jgi:hypothetical protein
MEIFWIALVFGWFSLMLGSSGRSGTRTGGRKIPMPPEHLRKGSVPKMRNPPPTPNLNKNHRDETSRSSK